MTRWNWRTETTISGRFHFKWKSVPHTYKIKVGFLTIKCLESRFLLLLWFGICTGLWWLWLCFTAMTLWSWGYGAKGRGAVGQRWQCACVKKSPATISRKIDFSDLFKPDICFSFCPRGDELGRCLTFTYCSYFMLSQYWPRTPSQTLPQCWPVNLTYRFLRMYK